MLKAIVLFAVSVYLTSTLFTLWFWLAATIADYQRNGKFVRKMPFSAFLYLHFCPITHTRFAFRIMRRMEQLRRERGM